MEREVARVAAACDLRAFRYIPFTGVEFDPIPIMAASEEPLASKPETVPAAAIPAALPPETEAIPTPFVQNAPPAAAPPAPIPAEAHSPPAWPAEPEEASPTRLPAAARRYRMLNELEADAAVPPRPGPGGMPGGKPRSLRPGPRPAMAALRDGPAAFGASSGPAPRAMPRRAWPR